MQKLYNVIVVRSVAVYAEDEEEAMNVYDFGEEYEAQESILAFPINEDDTINDICDDNLYMSVDLLTQAYLEYDDKK